jgi:HTH-type transcriptional regulator / antitoxin MqsA
MTMKCPCCGAAKLVQDTRNIAYVYKGEATTISAVTGDYCPTCNEVILNREQGDRYSELVGRFQKQINAVYVDPDYIAHVRKKLDLDQRQAAEIFGGGVNAFSRYENGKTKPSLALVKLLRVLEKHPDLLDEVKAT